MNDDNGGDEDAGTGTGMGTATATGMGTGTGNGEPERPARSFTGTGTVVPESEVQLDHEKLIVYRVARELVVYVDDLLTRKMPRELHDQLERSTISVLSNIGEGAGKTARAEKRRFYEIARGSATEAATQLDLLFIKRIIQPSEFKHARALLIRVVQMLSRLCLGPRTT